MSASYPIILILGMALVSGAVATAVGSIAVKAGFPLPLADKRIGCVDGLRGYLALAVLVHHFVIWTQVARFGGDWGPPAINILNNFGAGGVALFFMTTGLVFYPRILTGFRRTSWIATYTTRVFRIIPLVAVSVGIVTLVIVGRTGARPHVAFVKDALEWITSWKQTSLLDYPDSGRLDAYVLWSLWFEWVFYLLVLPVCALARDAIRDRAPSWVVPVTLLVVSVGARQSHVMSDLPRYLPLFALGMLAYEVQQRAGVRRLLQAPAAAVLACGALVFGLTTAPTPYDLPQMACLGFFFMTVACGNGLAGILRTSGALALGECSYGIYLLHGIVLDILFVEGRPLIDGLSTDLDNLLLPFAAIAVAALTPITYLCVERPAIRMGAKLARTMTGRDVRLTAPQVEVAP